MHKSKLFQSEYVYLRRSGHLRNCIRDFNWLVSYDIGDGKGGYVIDVRLIEAGWGVCEQGPVFKLLVRGREVGEKFVTV